MSRDYPDVGDALSFLDRDPVDVAPGRGLASGKTPESGKWLVRGLFVGLHALIIAIALNWAGLLHTPGFDRVRQMLHRATAPEGGVVADVHGIGPMAKASGIAVPPAKPRMAVPPVARQFAPPSRDLPGIANRPGPPRPNLAIVTVPAKQGRLSDGRRTGPDLDDGSAVAKAAREVREAEALLASKGLVRNSTAFALKSESDVKTRLEKLRERGNEFNAAFDRRAAALRLYELDQSINVANASIAELDFQMEQFTPTWFRGRWVHGMNMLDEEAYQILKSQRANVVRAKDTGLIPERNSMRAQHVPALPQAIEALKGRKESALAALNEARDAVAEAKKGYETLANDADVNKALETLGRARLAPSAEFPRWVQELGRYEMTAGQKVTFPAQ